MDQSAEHVREISNTLYKYHLDNFLCDVFVITPDGTEVPAHSVVLSAVSVKLRAAFEKSDNSLKKNFVFRLYVSDCDVATVEMVLQFIYTGSIVLQSDTPLDITCILSAGQKLGLDANKLATFLGALLSLTDSSVMENLPPVILTDEDICLEIVEKGKSAVACSPHFIHFPAVSISPTSPLLLNQTLQPHHETGEEHYQYSDEDVNFQPGRFDVETRSEHSTIIADGEMKAVEAFQNFTELEGLAEDERTAHGQDEIKILTKTTTPAIFSQRLSINEDGGGQSRCNICGKGLANDAERSEHERTVHKARVPCPLCPKTFASQRYMETHKVSQHGDGDGVPNPATKPFVCDICNHAFIRASMLITHQRTHSGDRPFQCEICGRRFICRSDLNKHNRLHVDGYLYKCRLCGKEIKTSRESADHKRMHDGGIVCEICGKSFTRLLNMQMHVRGIHGGERNFRCPDCGKAFIYAQNLRHHRRQHQPNAAAFAEWCRECQMGFKTEEALTQHFARSHAPGRSQNDRRMRVDGANSTEESSYRLIYIMEAAGNSAEGAESNIVTLDVPVPPEYDCDSDLMQMYNPIDAAKMETG